MQKKRLNYSFSVLYVKLTEQKISHFPINIIHKSKFSNSVTKVFKMLLKKKRIKNIEMCKKKTLSLRQAIGN